MLRAVLRVSRSVPSVLSQRAASMSWDPSTKYPGARRDESHIEHYKSQAKGDVGVKDPYVWLEDPDSKETQAFVEAQAEFTEAYLKRCEPTRTKFKEALTKAQDYPRFSVPSLKGDGFYYFNYNSGLQSQSVMYRVKKGEEDKIDPKSPGGELFFDTNLLSTDGTVAIRTGSFSKDGKYYAYALSRSGSDWSTIYVRETTSPHKADQKPGSDEGRLDDEVQDVKFSGITWTPDSKGFLYNRYPKAKLGATGDQGTETEANVDAKLYYHRLGTPQSEDILIAKNDVPKSTWMWSASFSEDGRWLYLYVSKDTGKSTLLWAVDYAKHGLKADLPWLKLINEWGADYGVIANDGSKHYLTTNKDAPREKVVTVDLDDHEKGLKDHIAEDEAVLKSAHVVGDELILLYSRDVKDELLIFDLQSGEKKGRIGENLVGVINSIAGRRDHAEFWFDLTAFTVPGQIYRVRYDGGKRGDLALYRSTVVSGINPDDFVSEQVFYESKDGTKVPMFIVSRKGRPRDGKAPAILYAYGGFAISIEPFFSPSMMTFIKHFDGVLAVANLRGGGEYGESWHLDGCFDKKQNVFDDFQAAARYLKERKIAGKVIISGGSNGGLLVGACTNQAPELFDAAVADVGVMDMLKFHRFTIGYAWKADYGDPDTPEAFDYLYKYSPVHNVDAKKTYPPVMLLTGDHDDRVVPLHSLKLAATLQHLLPHNPNPLLLRVELKAGHGAGKSTQQRIQEASDKWSYAATAIGLQWQD